jgi:hypothetical protein
VTAPLRLWFSGRTNGDTLITVSQFFRFTSAGTAHWATGGGNYTVQSEKLQSDGTAAIAVFKCGHPYEDQRAEVTISAGITLTGTNTVSAYVDSDGTASVGYRATLDGTNCVLSRSGSAVQTVAHGISSWATAHALRIERLAADITVYVDGTLLTTYTDGSPLTFSGTDAANPAFRLAGSAGAVTIDSFSDFALDVTGIRAQFSVHEANQYRSGSIPMPAGDTQTGWNWYIAVGLDAANDAAPTDNMGNTFVPVSSFVEYDGQPQWGMRVYACENATGGVGHIFTFLRDSVTNGEYAAVAFATDRTLDGTVNNGYPLTSPFNGTTLTASGSGRVAVAYVFGDAAGPSTFRASGYRNLDSEPSQDGNHPHNALLHQVLSGTSAPIAVTDNVTEGINIFNFLLAPLSSGEPIITVSVAGEQSPFGADSAAKTGTTTATSLLALGAVAATGKVMSATAAGGCSPTSLAATNKIGATAVADEASATGSVTTSRIAHGTASGAQGVGGAGAATKTGISAVISGIASAAQSAFVKLGAIAVAGSLGISSACAAGPLAVTAVESDASGESSGATTTAVTKQGSAPTAGSIAVSGLTASYKLGTTTASGALGSDGSVQFVKFSSATGVGAVGADGSEASAKTGASAAAGDVSTASATAVGKRGATTTTGSVGLSGVAPAGPVLPNVFDTTAAGEQTPSGTTASTKVGTVSSVSSYAAPSGIGSSSKLGSATGAGEAPASGGAVAGKLGAWAVTGNAGACGASAAYKISAAVTSGALAATSGSQTGKTSTASYAGSVGAQGLAAAEQTFLGVTTSAAGSIGVSGATAAYKVSSASGTSDAAFVAASATAKTSTTAVSGSAGARWAGSAYNWAGIESDPGPTVEVFVSGLGEQVVFVSGTGAQTIFLTNAEG